MNYDDFNTIMTSYFTVNRVTGYLKLKNHASHLKYINRAFLSWNDKNEDYFDQCPEEFDVNKLTSFLVICQSKSVQDLFKATKSFQKMTVLHCDTTLAQRTMSIYLGLLGIDESASKECRAITLDLLLRAGVLMPDDEGGWVLADDWEERRIYLYGNTKTVENMSEFVHDMQDRKISYLVVNCQHAI